jgi:hypothetical protein
MLGTLITRWILPTGRTALASAALAFGLAPAVLATPAFASDAPSYARLHPDRLPVDVMLVLAVDASQSMDAEEQKIQRDGYVQALTSPEVLGAIKMGTHGRIAVTYFEWGSEDQQKLIAPWMIVDSEASARHFVQKIDAAPVQNLYRTSISAALAYATTLIDGANAQADRVVIDISGDGPNNQGLSATLARDALVARGVTINGLPIVMKDADSVWPNATPLDVYYEDCVIGGLGAFAIPVHGMENFSNALKMKLILEIAGLMEPDPNRLTVIPAAGSARKPTNCSALE